VWCLVYKLGGVRSVDLDLKFEDLLVGDSNLRRIEGKTEHREKHQGEKVFFREK
jgi:hypothetical protein